MNRRYMTAVIIGIVAVLLAMKWLRPPVDSIDLARTLLPDPDDFDFYPPAPAMPPVVQPSMDSLLSEYETFLANEAPQVLDALQPGLTPDEISDLEAMYQTTLTDDLRKLYQWRNGTPSEIHQDAFPYQWFVPLDVALDARAIQARRREQIDPQRRQVYDELISHTYDWIDVIIDPAGEGFHFDPNRSEEEGSFFSQSVDEYVFYPSVRNYIAEIVQDVRDGHLNCTDAGIGCESLGHEQQKLRTKQFGTSLP